MAVITDYKNRKKEKKWLLSSKIKSAGRRASGVKDRGEVVSWRALANLMPGQPASALRMIGHWTGSAGEARSLIKKNYIIRKNKGKTIIMTQIGLDLTMPITALHPLP